MMGTISFSFDYYDDDGDDDGDGDVIGDEMMGMTWITPSNPALPKPKSFRCFRANLQLN